MAVRTKEINFPEPREAPMERMKPCIFTFAFSVCRAKKRNTILRTMSLLPKHFISSGVLPAFLRPEPAPSAMDQCCVISVCRAQALLCRISTSQSIATSRCSWCFPPPSLWSTGQPPHPPHRSLWAVARPRSCLQPGRWMWRSSAPSMLW